MAEAAPPTYGDEELGTSDQPSNLQILITPCAGATSFQNGYLGTGDHCALEGEVQVKGITDFDLETISITFTSVESATGETVELARSTVTLYSAPSESTSSQSSPSPPSVLPFSIPLTNDIPEGVTTPTSSITHTLTATLTPRSTSPSSPITKSTPVHITRYTAYLGPSPSHGVGLSSGTTPMTHSDLLPLDPLVMSVESPTHATIQIPRPVFRVGEPIPVYVTIPPPDRAAMSNLGLRLRNVKADLVRKVHVRPTSVVVGSPSSSAPLPAEETSTASGSQVASTSSAYPPEKVPMAASSSSSIEDGDHISVVRRSGAACRFHSSRPIRLRLVLHDNESNDSGLITQSTLLHQISFRVEVSISYTSSAQGYGHLSSSSVTIPVAFLPSMAPAPEGDFSQDIDTAYHKKHDPPPTRTSRREEPDESGELPSFDDLPSLPGPSTSNTLAASSSAGQGSRSARLSTSSHHGAFIAGPSSPSIFPPPSFSDASTSYAHAPPSFEDTQAGSSSMVGPHRISFPPAFEADHEGHLPSFIESESEVQAQARALASRSNETLNASAHPRLGSRSGFGYWAYDTQTRHQMLHFVGEGSTFGFTPTEEYDGIASSMMDMQIDDSTATNEPAGPPGLNGDMDTSTGIPPPPGIEESLAAAVTAAFSSGDRVRANNAMLPPPPPALDDPSDPPPSIDAGVDTLSQAQQSRMERAMDEAAAARAQDIPLVAVPPADGAGSGPNGAPPSITQRAEESQPPPYVGEPRAANVGTSAAGPPPYAG
ncbi:hypothetical protein DL93DRAFT_2165603 [Clavulina sp. PMI_390]|nr:hypothetical protein DL93DRAFT_2165603 [Clavulina sp. PMI_390]